MKKDKSTPRPRRALPAPKDATPLKKTKGKTGRKPGRPRVAGESTFVRLDAPTLKRVAARQRTLQEQNRIGNVSQSDTLRSLIVDGLDLADVEARKVMEEALLAIGQAVVVGLRRRGGGTVTADEERNAVSALQEAEKRLVVVALHREIER